jgi:hypothetical protein
LLILILPTFKPSTLAQIRHAADKILIKILNSFLSESLPIVSTNVHANVFDKVVKDRVFLGKYPRHIIENAFFSAF